MFDIFNVNLRKDEGFLTYIPCNPIPEYGQSNVPLVSYQLRYLLKCNCFMEGDLGQNSEMDRTLREIGRTSR